MPAASRPQDNRVVASHAMRRFAARRHPSVPQRANGCQRNESSSRAVERIAVDLRLIARNILECTAVPAGEASAEICCDDNARVVERHGKAFARNARPTGDSMTIELPDAHRGGLRLPALVATAVGVVVVQSTMISMLNGAGLGAVN